MSRRSRLAVSCAVGSVLKSFLGKLFGLGEAPAAWVVEQFEPRLMLTLPPSPVTGTSGADYYYLRTDPEDSSQIQFFISTTAIDPDSDTPAYEFARTAEDGLEIDAGNGNDSLTIDSSYGTVLHTDALTFDSGGGTDLLVLIGTSSRRAILSPDSGGSGTGTVRLYLQDYSYAHVENISFSDFSALTITTPNANDNITLSSSSGVNQVTGSSSNTAFSDVSFSNVPKLILDLLANDGGSGTDSVSSGGFDDSTVLEVKAGDTTSIDLTGGSTPLWASDGTPALAVSGSANVDLIRPATFTSIDLSDSAQLNLVTPNTSSALTASLTMSDSAVLDLRHHSFFVTYVSTSPYGDLKTWTDDGRDDLSGPQIISTPAQPEGTVFFTTPMAFDNEEEGFDTYTPDDLVLTTGTNYHEVVVRESYWGDANLDGMVSPADYSIVDGGIGLGDSWATGDLNLDDSVSPADYPFIDHNIGAGTNTTPTNVTVVNDEINAGATFSVTLPTDTDPTDKPPASYDILWGDGTTTSTPFVPGATLSPTHIFDESGFATVVVAANQYDGSVRYIKVVHVTIDEGPRIAFFSASDPAANPYTLGFSQLNGTSNDSMTIDWNDGSLPQIISTEDGQVSHSWLNSVSGERTFTIDVTDPDTGAENVFTEGFPAAPTITMAVASRNNDLVINWQDNSAIETGYKVEWQIGGSGTWNSMLLPPNVTTATVAGVVQEGSTYDVRVTAAGDLSSATSASTTVYASLDSVEPANLGLANAGETYTLHLPSFIPDQGWTIDWGEGTPQSLSGSATSADHVYQAAGSYAISVMADTSTGDIGVGTIDLVVRGSGPTTSQVTTPERIDEGQAITLALDRGSGPTQVSYSIDWGDGSAAETKSDSDTSASHIYSDTLESHAVTVTTTDSTGYVITQGSTVVIPKAPTNVQLTGSQLTWSNQSAIATGIEIQSQNADTGQWVTIAQVSPSTTSYQVGTSGTAFRVAAVTSSATSAFVGTDGSTTVLTDSPDPTIPAPSYLLGQPIVNGSSVTLRWVPPFTTSTIVRYEIFANGSKIDEVSNGTLQYIDDDRSTTSTRHYAVTAILTSGSISVFDIDVLADTANETDRTAPNPPTNLNLSGQNLTWNAPTDETPNHYEVYLNQGGMNVIFGTSWSIDPDSTYAVDIASVDSAGNRSAFAHLDLGGSPNDGTESDDSAWLQYIPPEYLDYLYSQIEPALRQRVALLNSQILQSRRWLDESDSVVISGVLTTLDAAMPPDMSTGYFDRNGNGSWDPGEVAWYDQDQDGFYEAGETLIGSSSWTIPDGTPSNGHLHFIDYNLNGTRDGSETVFLGDVRRLQGVEGALAYRDTSGDGAWSQGGIIWNDTNNNSKYDSGETVLYPAGATLSDSTWGKKEGLNYYDVTSNGYSSDDIVFVDHSSFRQDSVQIYQQLEIVAPSFDDGARHDYSKGSLLAAMGLAVGGQGSLIVTTGGQVTGSGTGFKSVQHIVPGSALKLGGKWYSVSSVTSDNELTISGWSSNNQSDTFLSYQTADWTLIPAVTIATISDTPLTRVAGTPDEGSAVFKEQFGELHDALGLLTHLADDQYFNVDTSASLVSSINKVLAIIEAIWGQPPRTGQTDNPYRSTYWLYKDAIAEGLYDAGARKGNEVDDLKQLLLSIAALVYQYQDGSIVSAMVNGSMKDVTMADVIQAQWNSDNDPLDELANAIDLLISNGLWLKRDWASTTSDATEDGWVSDSDGANGSPHPTVDHYTLWTDPFPGTEGVIGAQVFEYEETYAESTGTSYGHIEVDSVSHLVQTPPTSDNTLGGNDFTDISFDHLDSDKIVPPSTLSWGVPWTVRTMTEDELLDIARNYDWDGNNADFSLQDTFADPNPYSSQNTFSVYRSESDSYPPAGDTLQLVIAILYTGHWEFAGIFGLIPMSTAGGHTSPDLTLQNPGPAPTTEIPLTDAIDYLNTNPDSNLDGIVEVPHDQDSLGNDTGSLVTSPLSTEDAVIPLFTDQWESLPVHGYIAQNSTVRLPNPLITAPDADENGQTYAYSLDTRIRQNLYFNIPGNHIKRVEVIRPSGNAVVYNFSWEAEHHRFSTIGYPSSWDKRDASRLTILRDLNPDEDQDAKYDLVFPSGIVQHFSGTLPLLYHDASLTNISDDTGRSVDVSTGGSFYGSFNTGVLRGPATTEAGSSKAYDIALSWSDGQISKVLYDTKDGERTIRADLGYDASGRIISLSKYDGDNTTHPINAFSWYQLDGQILHAGRTIIPSGQPLSGTYSLRITTAGVDGSVTQSYDYNTDGLITSIEQTLDDGSTTTSATTAYTYDDEDRTRYSSNGAAHWGKLQQVVYPDGSWQKFIYDSNTGWVTQMISPFQGSGPSDDVDVNRTTAYEYGNVQSSDGKTAGGGLSAVPWYFAEQPRIVIDKVKGVETGRTYYSYGAAEIYGVPGHILQRPVNPGDAFDATESLSDGTNRRLVTVIAPNQFGPASVEGPQGASYYTPSFDGTKVQLLASIYGPADNSGIRKELDSTNTTLDVFGNVLNSKTTDFASGAIIEQIQQTPDSLGRVIDSSNLLSGLKTHAEYAAGDWFGPHSFTDADRSVTQLIYTSFGRVQTSTDANSIITTYGYDAAGNTISTQEAHGALSISTSARYDVQGRVTQSTDEMGAQTGIVYENFGGYNQVTTTYADQTTRIEQYYLDGSPKSLSGTSVHPVSYDSGVDPYQPYEFLGGSQGDYLPEQGGVWTKVMSGADNANVQTTFYNPFGQAYRMEQGESGSPAVATVQYDALGRDSKETDFNGNSTVYGYDQKGQVSQVLEDLDGDGAYSSGDRLTSYDGEYTTYNGQTVFQSTTTIRGFGGTADLADSVLSAISGMDVWEKVGSLPVSHSSFRYTGAGAAVQKDIASDGTSTIQTFANGILVNVKQVGRGGQVIQQESYGHDGLLRINSVTDAFGTTTIDLRSNGTAQGATYSDNRTEQTTQNNPATYDPTQYQRADGGIINMPENSQHQTTSVSGAGQLPTSFGYDPNTGRQTSLTTFRGDTTFEGGELSGSNSATTSWAYDPNTGLLASKSYEGSADPDISYGYDNLRLSQINRPGSNETLIWSGTDLDGVHYNGDQLASDVEGRDSFGRVTQLRQRVDLDVSDGQSFTLLQDWTTDYSYTGNGDLASESLPQLGSGFSTSYGYYPTSSATPDFLQSVSILNGTQAQLSIKYEYDPSSHRLQKITDPMESFSYSYKANTDLVESVSSRNGTKTSYSYEEDTGRLHSVTITKGIQTLYSETFTYNTNDQIETAAITQLQPDGTSKHYTYTYSYDEHDQLVEASGTTTNSRGSTIPYQDFEYSFDSAGNPDSWQYISNDLNQITTEFDLPAPYALSYDGRGNLTFDGQFTYVYSPQDRPVLEYDGTTELKLSYDAQGLRTSKEIYHWDANAGQYTLQDTRTFVYDGWNIIAEYQEIPGKVRHLLHSYTWDPNAALGGLLSVTDYSTGEAKTYSVESNYRGDVIGLTDALGNVVATYEYDPFGNQISSSGPAIEVCPFRGQSQYLDEQTGIRVFALRDEKFDRFMERDPSGEASDTNLYRLDGNDPVNSGDQLGLKTVTTEFQNGDLAISNDEDGSVAFLHRNGDVYLYQTPDFVVTFERRADGSEWARRQTFATFFHDEKITEYQTAPATKVIPGWDVHAQFSTEREAEMRQKISEIGKTAEAAINVAVDLTPVLGTAKAAYEGATGSSALVAGVNVGGIQRAAAIGFVAFASLKVVSAFGGWLREGEAAGSAVKGMESIELELGQLGGAAESIAAKESRSLLAKSLKPHNYPVPAHAHHIFPVQCFETPLGKRLSGWGIDLNSEVNGVWLPKEDFPGRIASIHRGRTGSEYVHAVESRLLQAQSREEAVEILDDIRNELLNGTLKINNAK